MKRIPKKEKSLFTVNTAIVGDSIESMLERLKAEGQGPEDMEDRDLVYNSDETTSVNPLTNIRTDKMEIMLEEKIAGYEYKHSKRQAMEEKRKAELESEFENGGHDE